MHGLQTIQAINAAATARSRQVAETKHSATVGGHYVFEPDGYTVIYHNADKLPEHPDKPVLRIDFKGDDGNGPRYDATTPATAYTNRGTAEVAAIAHALDIDHRDVTKRLNELFSNAHIDAVQAAGT